MPLLIPPALFLRKPSMNSLLNCPMDDFKNLAEIFFFKKSFVFFLNYSSSDSFRDPKEIYPWFFSKNAPEFFFYFPPSFLMHFSRDTSWDSFSNFSGVYFGNLPRIFSEIHLTVRFEKWKLRFHSKIPPGIRLEDLPQITSEFCLKLLSEILSGIACENFARIHWDIPLEILPIFFFLKFLWKIFYGFL